MITLKGRYEFKEPKDYSLDVFIGNVIGKRKKVVIKRFWSKDHPSCLNERYFLEELDHPQLPRVEDYFSEHGKTYLVISYYPGTEIKKMPELGNEDSVRKCLVEGAEILLYLQEKNIVHRDVTPNNLVQGTKLGLIDFGLAVFYQPPTNSRIKPLAATWAYMAPEQSEGHANFKSDVWGLGASMYFYLTGLIGIAEMEELWFPESQVGDVLKDMLERDLETRISASEVLERLK